MKMMRCSWRAFFLALLISKIPSSQALETGREPEFSGFVAYYKHPEWRERIRKDGFLEQDAQHASEKTRLQIQGVLCNWFNEKFLDASGDLDAFADFTHVEKIYDKLDSGIDSEFIASSLIERPLPAAWKNSAFRKWIRNKNSTGQAVPPKPSYKEVYSWPAQEQVEALVFWNEISEGGGKDAWDELWEQGSAEQISQWCGTLTSLREAKKKNGFKAFSDAEFGAICQVLAARVLRDIAVRDWKVFPREYLVQLADFAEGKHLAFIRLLAEELRVSSNFRNSDMANLIEAFTEKADSVRSVMTALKADYSLDWLRWLHDNGIIQSLQQRDNALYQDGLKYIAAFRDDPEFDCLFEFVLEHYYLGAPEESFQQFLRPAAKMNGAQALQVFTKGNVASGE